MAPEAAWAVTDILADMPSGQGRVALRARDGQRRVAYKTGTSYGFKDAWAVGFDATHTVAVWVGRPDAIGRPGETGASTAVPIMQKIFDLLPVPEHDVAADRPVKSVLARTSELPEKTAPPFPPQ
jgi:penicillin-binding protein 1C